VNGILKTFHCMQLRRVITLTQLKDHELRSLRVPTLYMVGAHGQIYAAHEAMLRLKKVAKGA
jgi:hypothetical protein